MEQTEYLNQRPLDGSDIFPTYLTKIFKKDQFYRRPPLIAQGILQVDLNDQPILIVLAYNTLPIVCIGSTFVPLKTKAKTSHILLMFNHKLMTTMVFRLTTFSYHIYHIRLTNKTTYFCIRNALRDYACLIARMATTPALWITWPTVVP